MMSSDNLSSNSSTWRLFCSGSRKMEYAGLNWPGDVLSWLSIVAIMISSLLETFSVTFLQRVIQFHGPLLFCSELLLLRPPRRGDVVVIHFCPNRSAS